MSDKLQNVPGMNDILPSDSPRWLALEKMLRQLTSTYGYQQIRLPVVEKTALFKRSIGEVTDIIEKEMYTFTDLNGDSLSLRPEGTAGCVRSVVQHNLTYGKLQKLWYLGPLFRHERTQKGRYRQFHQFGLEAFDMHGPEIDAELIFICARLWRSLGISKHVTLEVNSLGSLEARKSYRGLLVAYFSRHMEALDADSKRRLTTNPLRILDSKNPDMQDLIARAPKLTECLDEASALHFKKLCEHLDHANIHYKINPRLVRGLDYYNRTVFEWTTVKLGSQGTICAGGRYDSLVGQIGGKNTPAVGFAAGIERILELMEVLDIQPPALDYTQADVYLVLMGERAANAGLSLAESLHDQMPALRVITDCTGGSPKAQFKRADRAGAELALVLGDNELDRQQITVKYLRQDKPQTTVKLDELVIHLQSIINNI